MIKVILIAVGRTTRDGSYLSFSSVINVSRWTARNAPVKLEGVVAKNGLVYRRKDIVIYIVKAIPDTSR